ncbi:hypothetical protein D3C77_666110 [compost metagenome]
MHVGGRQARWPVMSVNQIGLPVDHPLTCGDLGGGQAQAGKTDMVVRPVAAVVGSIGGAFALI